MRDGVGVVEEEGKKEKKESEAGQLYNCFVNGLFFSFFSHRKESTQEEEKAVVQPTH